jgi:metal-responsive CopG/Arc/MetJ family transcriptional regulator
LSADVIYHIIIYPSVVAKKVAISITLDGDLLRDLDALLRETQARELRTRRRLSTRSSLIERIVREKVQGR